MKNKKTLYIIIDIVLVIVIGVSVFLFLKNKKAPIVEVEGCRSGDTYSMTSGNRCVPVPPSGIPGCGPDDTFSATTGERCAGSTEAK